MKGKFIVYALVVSMASTIASWGKTMSGSGLRNFSSGSGSSWSSSSGGGSYGGSGGHK